MARRQVANDLYILIKLHLTGDSAQLLKYWDAESIAMGYPNIPPFGCERA